MLESTLTCDPLALASVPAPRAERTWPAAYRYELLRDAASSRHEPAPSIMIVEDNADAGKMLTLLLRAKGWVCELCMESTAALAAINRFQPTVILLDIAMPGLNGLALARLIRARADGEQYVLIGVSGYGRLEDQRRAFDAGVDAYYLKPADIDELLGTIPALIAAKRLTVAHSG